MRIASWLNVSQDTASAKTEHFIMNKIAAYIPQSGRFLSDLIYWKKYVLNLWRNSSDESIQMQGELVVIEFITSNQIIVFAQ